MRNGWGHSCELDLESRTVIGPDEDVKLYYCCRGHLSPRVRPGDQVILPFIGGPAVLQFIKVENRDDPYDLYSGTIQFIDFLANIEYNQSQTKVINR